LRLNCRIVSGAFFASQCIELQTEFETGKVAAGKHDREIFTHPHPPASCVHLEQGHYFSEPRRTRRSSIRDAVFTSFTSISDSLVSTEVETTVEQIFDLEVLPEIMIHLIPALIERR
jgi:hypothetical protein